VRQACDVQCDLLCRDVLRSTPVAESAFGTDRPERLYAHGRGAVMGGVHVSSSLTAAVQGLADDPIVAGLQVYIVGGAVRDALLGLPAGDRDWVVVGASPEDMATRGFIPVGGDFPVFLHPRTKEEYALARTERKSGR